MKKGCYKDEGFVAALSDRTGLLWQVAVMTALPLSQSAIAVICDESYVK